MKYKANDNLKEEIKFFNLTKLSRKIGISRTTLSRIINGKINCKKTTAFCITKAINSNSEIDEFFERM